MEIFCPFLALRDWTTFFGMYKDCKEKKIKFISDNLIVTNYFY